MNPNQCRVVLRPRGPLEVLDLTFRLMRLHWRAYLRLTALLVGPWVLIGGVGCWLTDGHWAWFGLLLLVGTVIQGPFTLLSGRLLFAESVPLRDVLRDTMGRLGTLFGTWMVGALGWACAVCTVFFGQIPVDAALCFVYEAALLERVDLGRCVRRSFRLAGAQPGAALMGGASRPAAVLWGLLVGEATGQALVGFVFQLGAPFGALGDGVLTPYAFAGALLVHPILAVYRLLLYVDVRTRVEGWDLQVSLRAAGLDA